MRILEHNIRRYEERSYYYLRIGFVYICVGAALAVNYDCSYALVVLVLTGLLLVRDYGKLEYHWRVNSDICQLSREIEKLTVNKMKRIRRVLTLGTLVALVIDLIIKFFIIKFFIIKFFIIGQLLKGQ